MAKLPDVYQAYLQRREELRELAAGGAAPAPAPAAVLEDGGADLAEVLREQSQRLEDSRDDRELEADAARYADTDADASAKRSAPPRPSGSESRGQASGWSVFDLYKRNLGHSRMTPAATKDPLLRVYRSR